MSEFIVTIGEEKRKIEIISENEAILDGHHLNYELVIFNGATNLLRIEDKFYEIYSDRIDDENYFLFINGTNINSLVRTKLQERATHLIEKAHGSAKRKIEVKAPMPGMILKLRKKENDEIDSGESVLILEAMKMENDVKAPVSGTITSFNVSEGNAVEKGELLFIIE